MSAARGSAAANRRTARMGRLRTMTGSPMTASQTLPPGIISSRCVAATPSSPSCISQAVSLSVWWNLITWIPLRLQQTHSDEIPNRQLAEGCAEGCMPTTATLSCPVSSVETECAKHFAACEGVARFLPLDEALYTSPRCTMCRMTAECLCQLQHSTQVHLKRHRLT